MNDSDIIGGTSFDASNIPYGFLHHMSLEILKFVEAERVVNVDASFQKVSILGVTNKDLRVMMPVYTMVTDQIRSSSAVLQV